jgi:hypothetical protein
MARVKAPVAEDSTLEYAVDGGTVKVMSRPPQDERLAKLLELEPRRAWPVVSPQPDDEVSVVAFPDDPLNSVVTVDPVSFSLPGTPDGLVLQMDELGDGHLFAVGEDRLSLGSDGTWWVVTRLIEALEDPQTVATWPRFLTLGGHLGGLAAQASLQYNDRQVCIVWRRLESGVVGDLLSWHELSHERAQGWLNMLRPILMDLEQQRVHRHRLLPARAAERWARVLERAAE